MKTIVKVYLKDEHGNEDWFVTPINLPESYIIRKVNGSMISEIEFKRKNDHLFVRSKTNTASFRVSALFLDTTGVDLSLSMNIVDENLDDAEDIEIL